MRKILAILLPVLALVVGAFGGDMLKAKSDDAGAPHAESAEDGAEDAHGSEGDAAAAPADDHAAAASAPDPHTAESGDDHASGGDASPDDPGWVAFPNQFFVPVVRNGNLSAFVILTVTLETTGATRESVARKEHQLRDALLRRLMAHANSGGFDGNFTADAHMRGLRDAMLATARDVAGPAVTAVLIEDIGRQDS